MQLRLLTLGDKSLFDEHAVQMNVELSSYAFAPIYIWRDNFEFYWAQRDNYFCLFAKQNDDYFMPLPPLGRHPSKNRDVADAAYRKVVREAYRFMLETNRNAHIARIENVTREMLPVFGITQDFGTGSPQNNGFRANFKENEYLYRTEALAQLKGNRYKSKRHAYNVFRANYPLAEFRTYCSTNLAECFALYDIWHAERTERYDDVVYRTMLQHSRAAHRIGIAHAEALGLIGSVVYINRELKGYLFAYPLTQEIFCVMFEVAELKIKGLAQFLYREFARCFQTQRYQQHLSLTGAAPKWINAMGDSGLENLKRVKRSYHPTHLIPSYNVSMP